MLSPKIRACPRIPCRLLCRSPRPSDISNRGSTRMPWAIRLSLASNKDPWRWHPWHQFLQRSLTIKQLKINKLINTNSSLIRDTRPNSKSRNSKVLLRNPTEMFPFWIRPWVSEEAMEMLTSIWSRRISWQEGRMRWAAASCSIKRNDFIIEQARRSKGINLSSWIPNWKACLQANRPAVQISKWTKSQMVWTRITKQT